MCTSFSLAPARFCVSDPSIVLYFRSFSGKSLDHFSVGEEKPSSINHHSWGPGEKERGGSRCSYSRTEGISLLFTPAGSSYPAIPIRNLCFSNPRSGTLPPLNMSVIREEALLPIIAEIIAQVQEVMISLLTVASVNGYADHCRMEKNRLYFLYKMANTK
jgi:hypothetical protein